MDLARDGTLQSKHFPVYNWSTIADFGTFPSQLASYITISTLVTSCFFTPDVDMPFIDTGLSVSVGEVQASSSVYGRLDYMPPEVLEGKQTRTMVSDVYCFGTVMWELVTGVLPSGVASKMQQLLETGSEQTTNYETSCVSFLTLVAGM
ncbi:hypothetical protein BC936DRAFT_148269 [Jimgerdemannia flammicorona]|uniref:Protein kinase domain-containing protein n=1 Tax=Jimgerdemannia flammicorona TaxID=994334 RepID=A0A433D3D7_9FUNG|nr:hypothetical protein BC936DRAFT_148269 [Jimgerdemannia flammicorona]